MEFNVESMSDGRLRVFVDNGEEEPPALPAVANAHGTPLWPFVEAAVKAAPDAQSDKHGLWWPSRASALRAMRAAKVVLAAAALKRSRRSPKVEE